jgi:hypothetical protein
LSRIIVGDSRGRANEQQRRQGGHAQSAAHEAASPAALRLPPASLYVLLTIIRRQ